MLKQEGTPDWICFSLYLLGKAKKCVNIKKERGNVTRSHIIFFSSLFSWVTKECQPTNCKYPLVIADLEPGSQMSPLLEEPKPTAEEVAQEAPKASPSLLSLWGSSGKGKKLIMGAYLVDQNVRQV